MNVFWKLALIFCMSMLSFTTSALSFSELRFMHKPEHKSVSGTQNKKAQYLLVLGSFKVRANARAYREMIASKLDVPVHLRHMHNALFIVYIGPFDDVGTRNALRRKLSSLQAHHFPETHPQTSVWTRFSSAIPRDVNGLVTFNLGPAFTDAGKTQTLLLWPATQSTYVAKKSTDTVGFAEVFLGGARHFHQNYEAQLGLAVLGATNVNPAGDVLLASDPRFNNFSYDYKINHSHLALKGKLLSEQGVYALHAQPYVSAGVGVGFNHAYKFAMTPKIFEAVVPPLFQPNTTTSFMYTVGVGLQKTLYKHWQLGIGYAFSDWGKSELAAAPGQTETGHGLVLNHLYMNALEFGFTYRPIK